MFAILLLFKNLAEKNVASEPKKRHYKILRYDDTGKKSVVTVHVTTEEGDINEEEGQVLCRFESIRNSEKIELI